MVPPSSRFEGGRFQIQELALFDYSAWRKDMVVGFVPVSASKTWAQALELVFFVLDEGGSFAKANLR